MGQIPSTPSIIPVPFATNGQKNSIPETVSTAGAPDASWSVGFPSITMINKQAGGKPPLGKDFNGVLNQLSSNAHFAQSGSLYPWNATLNYLANAHILGSNSKEYVAVAPSGPDVPASGGGYVGAQNPINDSSQTYWIALDAMFSNGTPVGTIIWSANATVPAGYLLCNGSAVSRATYPELFAAIGTAFGNGDGSTTFNLPNLINKFIEGANTAGTVKAAGLPNITGGDTSKSTITCMFTNTGSTDINIGAYKIQSTSNGLNGTSTGNLNQVTFDASLSNSIYGNSTTVQPPAVTALPCIKY